MSITVFEYLRLDSAISPNASHETVERTMLWKYSMGERIELKSIVPEMN